MRVNSTPNSTPDPFPGRLLLLVLVRTKEEQSEDINDEEHEKAQLR